MLSLRRRCQADAKIQLFNGAAIFTEARVWLADRQIRDSLQRPQARLNEALTRTTQEQGAIQIGIAFKNRRNKSKALQGRQLKNRGDFSRYSFCVAAVRNLPCLRGSWIQNPACGLTPGRNHSNRILDDHATGPGPRPLPEHLIA